MEDIDIDELLKESGEDLQVIEKIITKEDRRREVNARYYDKNREKITAQNAMRIRCKLCNVYINKGSYQLHRKARLHQSLLNAKLDMIEDDEDNN